MARRSPSPRQTSIRTALREALEPGVALTLRELSGLIGVSEQVLPDHLDHLRKSLRAEGIALHIEPAACLACGFAFEGRTRFTRPGKCPTCRSRRIRHPAVAIGGDP